MREARRNLRYLPDAPFPGNLEITAELDTALSGARDALIVVPSHAFRRALESVAPRLERATRVARASCCMAVA